MAWKSVPVVTGIFSILLLPIALHAQATDAASSSNGTSKVRIVRLSEVKGVVHLDRSTGRGFEPAMANLPIVEQNILRTDDGVAEVEFEDNSTLRLAPDTLVDFPKLERTATGSTASSVHVIKGTAYVSLVNTKGNEFTLLFADQKLALQPATHIRLDLKENEAQVAVLDGALHLDGAQGPIDVSKKKTVTFQTDGQNQPMVAKNVESETFDTWDHTAAGYHARTASLMGSTGSPYSYGINDMSYYGSFMNAAGCGSMWRPYFASAAWDPYSNGVWAYYPSAGYSWVSPYPWGWTPYHSGAWSYCPSAGWGWMPNGSWYGLNNIATNIPTSRFGTAGGGGGGPIRPIRPPRAGEPTMLAINAKPLVRNQISSAQSFEFRKDSAGFGIPREGFGKLDKISRDAVSHGVARTPIYVNVPQNAVVNGRVTSNSMAAVSVHRGSAPSGPSMGGPTSTASRGGYSGGGGGNSGRGSSMGSAPASSASHASAPASGTRSH